MGQGGRKKRRVRVRDEFRWYEILFCCCKCRKECKECVTRLCLYVIPSIFMILLTAACITFGILWRTDCDRHETIPYWLFGCAVSPYLLLVFVKALKEDYVGITCWRMVSVTCYLIFTAWLIYGCLMVYDQFIHGSSRDCNKYLTWFAFCLTFVHWIIFIIATVILVYMMTKVCCCCTPNVIKPLKPSFVVDEYV